MSTMDALDWSVVICESGTTNMLQMDRGDAAGLTVGSWDVGRKGYWSAGDEGNRPCQQSQDSVGVHHEERLKGNWGKGNEKKVERK